MTRLDKVSATLAAALFLGGAVGCTLYSPTSNTNVIKIIIGEQPKPVAGCEPMTLDATPSAGGVTIDVSPDPCGCSLTVDGANQGPTRDGMNVKLGSGEHELQLVAGACISNVATIEVL